MTEAEKLAISSKRLPPAVAFLDAAELMGSGSPLYRVHRPAAVLAEHLDWITLVTSRHQPPTGNQPWLVEVEGQALCPNVLVLRATMLAEKAADGKYGTLVENWETMRSHVAAAQTRTFTPYPGWENDVSDLASAALNHFAGAVGEDMGQRLLAAFEPPKCGKELRHKDDSTVDRCEGGRSWRPLTCCLPAGHHPFEVRNATWPNNCKVCSKRAEDAVHSPGHIADVPESAWQ